MGCSDACQFAHKITAMERLLDATHHAERAHFWFRGFRLFVRPMLERAAAGRSGLRILDAGCGTGNNLSLIGDFGRAYGFDVTWHGLRYARRAGHSCIARASIVQIPFADASFDLVTSFDVLACLSRSGAERALGEIRRVLKPGGALVLNTAAFRLLRGNHGVVAYEVHRYTRLELKQAIQHAGFRIERLTYTNASLMPVVVPFRLAQRLAGLATPEEAGTDFTMPPVVVNDLLSGILALEARLLRLVDMPIGSSLLCLAWKRA